MACRTSIELLLRKRPSALCSNSCFFPVLLRPKSESSCCNSETRKLRIMCFSSTTSAIFLVGACRFDRAKWDFCCCCCFLITRPESYLLFFLIFSSVGREQDTIVIFLQGEKRKQHENKAFRGMSGCNEFFFHS